MVVDLSGLFPLVHPARQIPCSAPDLFPCASGFPEPSRCAPLGSTSTRDSSGDTLSQTSEPLPSCLPVRGEPGGDPSRRMLMAAEDMRTVTMVGLKVNGREHRVE